MKERDREGLPDSVDTGVVNSFCPDPETAGEAPVVDVLIITECA